MQKIILVLLIGSIFVQSCSDGTKEKKSETLVLNNNVDSLALLIDLTKYKPSSVIWTVKKMGIANDRVPGPTDYNLQALMTFDSSSINSIKSTYRFFSVSFNPKDTSKFKFSWLPQGYVFVEDTQDAITYEPKFFQSPFYSTGHFIINKNDILLSYYTQ